MDDSEEVAEDVEGSEEAEEEADLVEVEVDSTKGPRIQLWRLGFLPMLARERRCASSRTRRQVRFSSGIANAQ